MQLVFHLGAHSTDEERLIRTLAGNPEALAGAMAHVPSPRAYRGALRDALIALKGRPADAETQARLREACVQGAIGPVERLVFSYENFLALPDRAITAAGLYPAAADKLAPLANLFPAATTEFHLGLVNPAVLIAALVARQPGRSYDEILAGQPPEALRWGPVVARMVGALRTIPGARLVLWCNEDLPLIFPEVLRSLAAIAPAIPLAGEDGLIETLMTEEGMRRMRSYLSQHPPQTVAQRRKVAMAFLDKFARPETLETEIPLPGWTDDLVAQITADYEADVAGIAALEGVSFIAP